MGKLCNLQNQQDASGIASHFLPYLRAAFAILTPDGDSPSGVAGWPRYEENGTGNHARLSEGSHSVE